MQQEELLRRADPGGKKEFKKNDWSFGGYRRKSDNPDVLFGRDFEDDFITIEKIEGEIGEVTVRGKILDKDSRELRSGKTIIIFHITDFTRYDHGQGLCQLRIRWRI